MKSACIVEARMRSTRLPGKTLMPILGKPMLALLVERLKAAKGVDDVILATTVDPSCDPIEAFAREAKISCFRGSEDDVLGRVLGAAQAFGVDVIVETTGDNPLLDARTIEACLSAYRQGDVDYVSNVLEPTYPVGICAQVFSTKLLAEVDTRTNEPHHREHVSLYMYEDRSRYRLRNVASGLPRDAAKIRLTVDTKEDFAVVERVFEAIYPKNPAFGLDDILAFFARNPDVARLNEHVKQKPAQPEAT